MNPAGWSIADPYCSGSSHHSGIGIGVEARDVLREGPLHVQQMNLHRRVLHELLDDMPGRILPIAEFQNRMIA